MTADTPQTPTRADSPGHRPQDTSSVSRAEGSAPGLATTGAPFDDTHPAYVQIFELLVDQVAGDASIEMIERAFGVAQGVATMLVPGVYENRELPAPDVSDVVSSWIWSHMEEAVKAR